MAEVRIGELHTEVSVTDTEALLHPAVLERITALVERRLADKARDTAARHAETRIGGGP